jgi:hypothetical protein
MRNLVVVAALGLLPGCSFIQGLIGGDPAGADAAAQAALIAGDLPGATNAWTQAGAENPGDPTAATGAAYAALLAGDYTGADALLAAAEANAGERLDEIKLRRALVALRAANVDGVREHAGASKLPVARLLYGEALLADGETDQAKEAFEAAKAGGGSVGEAATGYLTLLGDEDSAVLGLAEAQALWALGVREVAVKSAFELVSLLPAEREDRSAQLLLWAGRAATVPGQAEAARSMLGSLDFAPDGQQWRVIATKAIIECASGDGEACVAEFKKIEGQAPEAGLADAKATAALMIADKDAAVVAQLVGPYESNAAARALFEAGDKAAALEKAPAGIFRSFLESGG